MKDLDKHHDEKEKAVRATLPGKRQAIVPVTRPFGVSRPTIYKALEAQE